MDITTIAVVGSGIMGRGIAYAAAVAGYRTRLNDVSTEALARALGLVRQDLDEGVRRGKLEAAAADEAFGRLAAEPDLAAAADGADFVIEAVSEDMALKLRLFAELDRRCGEDVVLATNTSALSVTEIAAAAARPQRVLGMHFFNPVPKMRLVEIVRALETSERAVEITRQVAVRMGKETVLVKESPGFITSRINAMIGNEAFQMLQEGVATPRDIDKALKLGLNHPMGPFEMIDLVGLDTRLAVLRHLHERLGEKYRPSSLLVQYVSAGRLGRKVGRGVYDYAQEPK